MIIIIERKMAVAMTMRMGKLVVDLFARTVRESMMRKA